MDEYFEQHDCLHHPSFVQLTDTLVAATLNYYNTDFGTLLETEIAQNLSGTGSRFAGLKRYGSVRLPAIADTAGKEAAAHAFLELLDGFADGGLADVKLLGSLGDIACVGYCIKNPIG